MDRPLLLRPAPALAEVTAYAVPRARAPVDLRLDGNEGKGPGPHLFSALSDLPPEALAHYPSVTALQGALANRLGVDADQVIVTAGADEALDRVCRAVLAPGRRVVLPVPGFEMMPRYARLAGADIVEVPWPDARFPLGEIETAIDEQTALVVLTSPNNPTGAVVPPAALCELAARFPAVLFAVDEAYAEFAGDVALGRAALSLDNAVLVRTLSKAWGVAGLRVGYAAARPEVIRWLAAAGSPYPVSSTSAALALARLERGEAEVTAFVERVQDEREQIAAALEAVGARPVPSRANFVFARLPKGPAQALWLRDAMAGLGVALRAFPGRPGCEDAVRVTCPGDEAALARLTAGLFAALTPEALLFDLDGVLADVSGSYRAAILGAADAFGVALAPADIEREKQRGGANDDWELTWRLVNARGASVSLADVTQAFEELYQGTPSRPGLKETERLLIERAALEQLRRKRPLGIVTGRPRRDAEEFLTRAGIHDLFDVVIAREDAALKPDPAPVRLALARLGVTAAWLIGDTPDDVSAARRAGVVPVGVLPPGVKPGCALEDALYQAGAARVLDAPTAFRDLALEVLS